MNIKKVLVAVVAMVMMAVGVLADTATVNGIEWTYTVSDGKASIYHSYWASAIPETTTGAITIPSSLGGYPVTSIGDYAFWKCEGLTSVTIPDSVTSIGYCAFFRCSGLTSVTIGNSVTSIGGEAFEDCSGLTSITIPDSVTSIGKSAFSGCSGLTSVTIPNSVTSIGGSAFRDCSGLMSVTIPDSVTSIGGSAFYGCSGLASITIPDSVTSIGVAAFWECDGLTSVTIPDSVTSIGEKAFYSCDGLTSVTIPDSVTSIGDSAFRYCYGLTSITIPDSVTSIGGYAFYMCRNLKFAIFLGDAPKSVGDCIFDSCHDDFVIKVKRGTYGWDGDWTSTAIPETWHGYPIEGYGDKFSLQNASVSSSIAISSTMYDGTAKTNSLTIEYNGNTLINGLDFELSYLNNIDAGVASVIATGIGDFSDCITNTFILNSAVGCC